MTRFPKGVDAIKPEVRERIRLAILDLRMEGEDVTQRAVRERAKVDQRSNAKAVKAYKDGRMPDVRYPWAGSWAPIGDSTQVPEADRDESSDRSAIAGLAEQIRSAETDDDRAQIQQEACALALEGSLEKWQAEVIEKTLKEARQSAKAHRDAGGDEDVGSLLLANEEVYELVRVYEGLVSPDRRARVLELLVELAQADRAEHPNVDRAAEIPQPEVVEVDDEQGED